MRSISFYIMAALLSLSLLSNFYLLPFYLQSQDSNWSEQFAQYLSPDNKADNTEIKPKSQPNIQLKPSKPAPMTASKEDKKLETINELFEQQNYQQAIQLFLELDEQIQTKVKQSWLLKLQALLTNNKSEAVLKFSQAYLTLVGDDSQIMQLLAQSYVQRGDLLYALELYYQLSRNLIPSDEEQQLTIIHKLALAEIKRFTEEQAWDELNYFVSPLLDYEADYPPYLLAQAQAHFQQQDYNQALIPLVSIISDPHYGEQATELETKILEELGKLEAITLLSQGEHYIISGEINGQFSSDLMIDTGASLSVISQAHFDALGIDSGIELIGQRKIGTAGGEVIAPVYRFESFSINHYEVKDIEFVVLELNSLQGSHGLLGMNFLKNFKFEIDQENKLLILNQRS